MYENYPPKIVILTALNSIGIYTLGTVILFSTPYVGFFLPYIYLVYCIFMEINLLRSRCSKCYYYGKLCGFGKGKIAAVLFAKDEAHSFTGAEITFLKLIPDLLISFIPIIGGLFGLFKTFNILLLVFYVLFIILSFVTTGKIRGSLVCKHCKQGEIGCPAADFFNKDKTDEK